MSDNRRSPSPVETVRALQSGMSQAELARLSGMSRQRIFQIKERIYLYVKPPIPLSRFCFGTWKRKVKSFFLEIHFVHTKTLSNFVIRHSQFE